MQSKLDQIVQETISIQIIIIIIIIIIIQAYVIYTLINYNVAHFRRVFVTFDGLARTTFFLPL